MTVPVLALVLLLLALMSSSLTRSFRFGLVSGIVAMATGFVALFAVLALEGIVWMDRRGVFILDGDPPEHPVDNTTVVFDIFTTGMWVGHAIVCPFAILLGAAIGTGISGLRRAA